MKLSIIFTSALAAMAVASPATNKRVVSRRSPGLLDGILDTFNSGDIGLGVAVLKVCLSEHKTFHTDFTKANDGVFSITNVDHTCCEKAKEDLSQVPDDRFGKTVFNEPCDGATVTGLSKMHMKLLEGFFNSI